MPYGAWDGGESRDHLSLSPSFHFGVASRGLESRLILFNDSQYGPYRGSIVRWWGVMNRSTTGFGDAFGIYYRHFVWSDGRVLWTLFVSLWYPLVLFGTLAVIRQAPEA